jgi:hypothetical protein
METSEFLNVKACGVYSLISSLQDPSKMKLFNSSFLWLGWSFVQKYKTV